jgi:hypothetical protein
MKLRPLTSKPKERSLAAFDVQGDKSAALVAASLVTDDDERTYTEADDLIADMTTRDMRGTYVYSHRLTYDAGVLVEDLPGETSLAFINEKMFRGRMEQSGRHKVYLADSSGMWGGMPLSSVSREVGLSRLPMPETVARHPRPDGVYGPGELCQGPRVQDFTVRESAITLAGMRLLQNELLELGGELKNTLPATAMALFRRCYLDDEYWTPFDYRNDFARRAYYGGRCEPFVLGWWDQVNVYDFHSHYPSQMVGNSFPNPNSTIGPRQPGRLEWIQEKEGCSDCTVDVPYAKYPVLPLRVGFQNFYPVGQFRGVWCHNELRYAMEHGTRIKRVYATMYSEDTVSPFDDYVTDLWERRKVLKAQGSPRHIVYKLLLNSLAGKFGQREGTALRQLETMAAYDRHKPVKGTEIMVLRNTAYAKVPIQISHKPEYIIVPWAAYITAYARIALHKAMLEVSGPLVYVDTDCLMCFSDLPTGDSLGELELQAKGAIVDMIAPKMYDLVFESGERQPVAKGIPAEMQGDYCTYKEIEYWKALNWCEAARLKLDPSVWVEVKKKLMLSQPKRRYKKVRGFRGKSWVSEPLVAQRIPGVY